MQFANLGLVVVDEQHRLGVRQRAALSDKGSTPHYLVMTATPIPRTLALSYFADFDVSAIDELPPGRQPITTRWLRPNQAAEAWQFVREQVRGGRQAYIVVPQIEDDDRQTANRSRGRMRSLAAGPLADLRLAALHGQMPTEQKEQTMTDFRDGRIDVLVCHDGDRSRHRRAQRHGDGDRQGRPLRPLATAPASRPGRPGDWPSHCILLSDAPTPGAEARLSAMMHHHQRLRDRRNGPAAPRPRRILRHPPARPAGIQTGRPDQRIGFAPIGQGGRAVIACRRCQAISAEPCSFAKALLTQFGKTMDLAQVG